MKLFTLLFAFILGVFLTIFVYQAFTIYQLRSVVASDHTQLTEVVNFLNTQIQAAQQANGKGIQTTTSASAATATSVKK